MHYYNFTTVLRFKVFGRKLFLIYGGHLSDNDNDMTSISRESANLFGINWTQYYFSGPILRQQMRAIIWKTLTPNILPCILRASREIIIIINKIIIIIKNADPRHIALDIACLVQNY